MNFFFYASMYFLIYSILAHLLFNSKIINSKKNNFPIVDKEVFYQMILILLLLVVVIYNSNILGDSAYYIFKFNNSTKFFQIILTCVMILILPSVFLSCELQKLNFIEFFCIILCALLSMYCLINSVSLLSIFISLELQTICFYILTAYNKSSVFSSEAGIKYFVASAVFSGIFLLGVSIIYFCFGTINFVDIKFIAFNKCNLAFDFIIIIGLLLTIIWFLFKLTCAPFYFWAPDVYEGAPLGATIIFSIPAKIATSYVFLKWVDVLTLAIIEIKYYLIFFGLFSCLIGTFFSLSQQRIKRLIIYSSIAQIGFFCSTVFIGNLDSFVASIIFLLIYVLTSILVWNHVVLLYFFQSAVNTATYFQSHVIFFSNFFELGKKNNAVSFSFVLVMFSIAGIPPLLGFFSKFVTFESLLEYNEYLITTVFIIISSISVFYYIKILKIIFFEGKNYSLNKIKINFLTYNNILINYIFLINVVLLASLLVGLIFPDSLYILSKKIIVQM